MNRTQFLRDATQDVRGVVGDEIETAAGGRCPARRRAGNDSRIRIIDTL